MTNQPNPPVEVTQADYRLAAEIMGYKDANQARASSPTIKLRHRELSGLLARHRLSAIAQARREALEEAAETAYEMLDDPLLSGHGYATGVRTAILGLGEGKS